LLDFAVLTYIKNYWLWIDNFVINDVARLLIDVIDRVMTIIKMP